MSVIQVKPKSKIAVAAGAGGIGRALVDALHAQQADIAVLDLPNSLAAASFDSSVKEIEIDARRTGSIADAFTQISQEWGSLDGFVNLVGFTAERKRISEMEAETWSEVVDGNLNAAFRLCKEALPLLKKSSAASLVNVTSSLSVKPNWGYGPYSTSKAGINALTRMLAFENAPDMRVNAVAPSAIDTPFLRGGTGRKTTDEDILDKEAYAKTIPVGRIGHPGDVVAPIMFLLSPGSAYITGQVLHVNGGAWMP